MDGEGPDVDVVDRVNRGRVLGGGGRGGWCASAGGGLRWM